jgi:hypothetical protein
LESVQFYGLFCQLAIDLDFLCVNPSSNAHAHIDLAALVIRSVVDQLDRLSKNGMPVIAGKNMAIGFRIGGFLGKPMRETFL